MLYLHETLDVIYGKADEYAAAVEKLFLPIAKRRDLRPVGFWNTVSVTGRWPEVIAFWEIDDWSAFARQRETHHERDRMTPGLTEYLSKASQWRSGGFDRMLVPAEGCRTLKELVAGNVKGKVFLHETIECKPANVSRYMETTIDGWPIARRLGLEPIGAYQSAFRDFEVLNIWALKDWQAWATFQESQSGDPKFQAWTAKLSALRTRWEAKLLTPVSWCPLAG
ncbi:MAG: hypothetical protein HY261_09330 [Chloroflexi bacterium]|nr:hypothetical protein [Chloroflexota bacterium]